jgi:hypothetical protein
LEWRREGFRWQAGILAHLAACIVNTNFGAPRDGISGSQILGISENGEDEDGGEEEWDFRKELGPWLKG